VSIDDRLFAERTCRRAAPVSVLPAGSLTEEAGGERSEFVAGFTRGMAVIRCFSATTPALTIAEVARAAGLSRSTARRLLRTLEAENYVGFQAGRYFLRPGILELGYSYLAASSVDDMLQSRLFEVAEQVRESCTAAVLDGHEADSWPGRRPRTRGSPCSP
jgi:IclR family pca regulon transcriptional regulator